MYNHNISYIACTTTPEQQVPTINFTGDNPTSESVSQAEERATKLGGEDDGA